MILKISMKWIQNTPLKQKLIVSYLILIIIPIMVLGLYSYYQSKSYLEKQLIQNLRQNVESMASNVDYKAKLYHRIVDSIIYNAGIQKIFNNNYTNMANLSYDLKSFLEPSFTSIIGLNNDIKQLTIYTQNDMPEYGNYILKSDRVLDTPWYKKAVTNLNTEWFYNKGDLAVVRKIPDIYFQSRQSSILYIKLDNSKMFETSLVPANGDFGVMVTDQKNNIIYQSSVYANEMAHLRGLANNKYVEKDGFLILSQEIPTSGWTLLYYIPLKFAAVDATKIIEATAIIIFICLFILFILIWLFSRTLIKPIHKLNQKMELVENGEMNVLIHSNSKDEIGLLTNRFGNMLKKINELIQEVYQNKINQQEAELKTLQAQINPHFLYNTLSIIKWKSLKADEQEISKIVSALAKFYRTVLNKGNDMISVSEEISNIKSYLEIMVIMKDHKFDVIYDIDDEVYNYKVINLILQPIIENAIEHGINHKANGRGLLKIIGKEQDRLIIFSVEDNGLGMSKEKSLEILSHHSKGYGLKNVNDRMKLFFGNEYQINIESELDKGTVMRICFPKEYKV